MCSVSQFITGIFLSFVLGLSLLQTLNKYCGCTQENSGINQISWTGLGNIAMFDGVEFDGVNQWKDAMFNICSSVCPFMYGVGYTYF